MRSSNSSCISSVAENLAFDQLKAEVAKLAPAAEEAVMTIAEQLRAQGLKQGIAQGHEQGLEQGREQGLEQGREQGLELGCRQSLEKLLTLKFGPLSNVVAARIQAADSETLDRWLERVLTAESAESVLEG